MSELGKLEKLTNLRLAWSDEARDFTPWLAKEENLSVLAEALGLGPDGLELEALELPVGTFRADILCRDTTSVEGDRVLIENQFGKSDHDHLGKLLTYASGLKAKTIILIGEGIREEHRAALDWMNEITNDEHRFFACEVELWRIGDSLPAPKFNLIVKPNDWARQLERSVAPSGILTELKQTYVEYWSRFAESLVNANTRLRPGRAQPQQWMNFPSGRSGIYFSVGATQREQFIRVSIVIQSPNAKDLLELLRVEQTTIEEALGYPLVWDEKPNAQRVQIHVTLSGTDPTDKDDWARQHEWLISHLSDFNRVFRPRLAILDVRTEIHP